MTINVVTPAVFGPGLKVQADSSNTGHGGGSFWNIVFSVGTSIGQTFWIERHNTDQPLNVYAMTVPSTGTFSTQVPSTDTTVTMELQFIWPGHATDVLDVHGQWDGQTGLGVQAVQLSQTPITAGGLTTDQDAALTQTLDNTNQQQIDWTNYTSVTLPSLNDILSTTLAAVQTDFIDPATSLAQTVGQVLSYRSIDFLTLTDGPSEVCDHTDWNIGGASFFGVILRITNIPDYWVFTTPDSNWSVKDLAVITIRRGSDDLLRMGVHTPGAEISPLPSITYPPTLGIINTPWVPPDYHVIVDFAPGVCGSLFGRVYP